MLARPGAPLAGRLLAVGMLTLLGVYSSGLLVAALVGGTATAVAGGCVTAIGQATLRRR